ncbi:glycosyltransferase [Helicobacter sp. 13S00477-4]|uniref:glycosyltransferase family 8 protein n=1 Tax=Helicobacter sp. 13S00477-4 TaxID=1905759 RepID=UPI000BA63DDD|nr:glycosyltransferase [Helicobacter sp. 13S00477-4]PAF51522.1 hypothetical protein BKH44_05625 [Helicobacter sp. 13S00477-4]
MGGGVYENIEYRFYVIHNDISQIQIQKLQQIFTPFAFASLKLIQDTDRFENLWNNILTKHHFAKEIFYKIVASSLFPQYEKIIISDVDVIFLDDVKESFLAFNTDEKIYLSGIKSTNPNNIFPLTGWKEGYKKFSKIELESIMNGIGAGYFIANLKQIRKDKIEEKMIDYAIKNAHKLIQPEQDILNIVCYPYIKSLSLRHMISHTMWQRYGEKWEKLTPVTYPEEEITQARINPIQIHYDGNKKPWKYPNIPKSDLWFYYLVHTPFAKEFFNQLTSTIIDIYKQQTFFYRLKKLSKQEPLFFLKIKFYKKIYDKSKRLVKTLI